MKRKSPGKWNLPQLSQKETNTTLILHFSKIQSLKTFSVETSKPPSTSRWGLFTGKFKEIISIFYKLYQSIEKEGTSSIYEVKKASSIYEAKIALIPNCQENEKTDQSYLYTCFKFLNKMLASQSRYMPK